MNHVNRIAEALAAVERERRSPDGPANSRTGRAVIYIADGRDVFEVDVIVSPTKPDLSHEDGWHMTETPAGWIASRVTPE